MVSACLDARRVTDKHVWSERARKQFNWFIGHNQLERAVYDASTGGCRDGLHPGRLNENQGAESTLSFLMALAEMRISSSVHASAPGPRDVHAPLHIGSVA